MSGYESLRRRIKALDVDVKSASYGVWMHEKGYYLPVDDPRNKWTENGVLHIAVPAKLTEAGRKLGLKCQEITIGVPIRRCGGGEECTRD